MLHSYKLEASTVWNSAIQPKNSSDLLSGYDTKCLHFIQLKSTLILCVCGLLSTSSHLIHNYAFTSIEIVLLCDYWLQVHLLLEGKQERRKVKYKHGERKYAQGRDNVLGFNSSSFLFISASALPSLPFSISLLPYGNAPLIYVGKRYS